MEKREKLKLSCMAIGSLPHNNLADAMKAVENNFAQIPFWPQLVKLSLKEGALLQYTQGLPGLIDTGEKIYLDNESDAFFEQLETFFMDYEEIVGGLQEDVLNKYAITKDNSITFESFLEIVKKNKTEYAKGQIVGPFTLATSLKDKNGKCAYYDETLREIIVKLLSIKALWQMKEIKKACKVTVPIIFIDEPSLSQLGTSAFITIPKEDVVAIIKEVSDLIKANGGLSAVHCCGKADWSILIDCKVDIINLDAYFFAQNLSTFSNELESFLRNGGIIAWGVVPTLDKQALEDANLSVLVDKFEEALGYLAKKGIDKSLLINQSMITPSCGAGALSVELAQKAMSLTQELSLKLKETYI